MFYRLDDYDTPRAPEYCDGRAHNATEQEYEASKMKQVVDRLIGHQDTDTGICYILSWYEYSPTDDTYELVYELFQAYVYHY